jgi:hypothetical protein
MRPAERAIAFFPILCHAAHHPPAFTETRPCRRVIIPSPTVIIAAPIPLTNAHEG